jgi:hypothetical protein
MHIRLLGLALVLLTLVSMAQAQEETGLLEPLAGSVMFREDETLGWEPVTTTINIEDGIEIQTDASGRALLTYGDGLSTEILGNTHIIVEEIEYSDAGRDIEILIEVLVGDTYNTIDAELPEEGFFEIQTPNVLIMTRAAHWYTFTAPNGDTLIAAVDGTLATEQVLQQNAVTLQAQDGQSVIYAEDGSVGWVLNSLLIGTDAEVDGAGDDRFDFARELSCMTEGVCNYFCIQPGSAPLCDTVAASGFLNCAERVHVDQCAQILSERPSTMLSREDWRIILAARVTDNPPAPSPSGANQPGRPPGGGGNPPRGNQPSGDGGPPAPP